MTHGSLFSGIGGFDLAAEWMGWENVFHCEWNEFGKRVLNYYWPKAISYHDITQTDFTIHRGQIDILTGGFPCQPFSAAGKRKGTEDDRHLWPEMLRAIREIAPRYIVGENVYGLVNWDGGMVFEQVQADLEAEGYEVTPVILSACAVNAPHRRDRIWFVAYCKNKKPIGRNGFKANDAGIGKQGSVYERGGGNNGGYGIITNPKPTGLEGPDRQRVGGTVQPAECATTNAMREQFEGQNGNFGAEETGRKADRFKQRGKAGIWENFPTQSPICSRNDEFSARLDGITFPKWRNESIKAYGNAVVPELVVQIFKAIEQHNNHLPDTGQMVP